MHAEVLILFAADLREGWVTTGLPPSSEVQTALALTRLEGSADLVSAVVHARIEITSVYVLFMDDRRSVRIYVEGRAYAGDLRQLARRSEQLCDTFIRAGEAHGVGARRASINLYAGEALVTCAVRRGFGERWLTRFGETVLGDVMMGVFTGVLTVSITGDRQAAMVAALASVLCFAVWLAVEIRRGGDAYEYSVF